jgi:hypothetical protein
LGAIGLFQTVIGLPSMTDDLAKWPPILADIGRVVGVLQEAAAPIAGDVARWSVLLGAAALVVWTNLPRRSTAERSTSHPSTIPPPEPGQVVGTIRSFSVPANAPSVIHGGPAIVRPTPPTKPTTGFGPTQSSRWQPPLIERGPPFPPVVARPALPRRLRGLKGGELSTFGWNAIIARQRLRDEGGRIKGQVNQAASATYAPGVEPAVDELRSDVEAWEDKVRAFDDEWGWEEADILRTLFDEAEAAVDPAIVPRPESRARLQGRLDAGLDWLDDHDIAIESVGLHTE